MLLLRPSLHACLAFLIAALLLVPGLGAQEANLDSEHGPGRQDVRFLPFGPPGTPLPVGATLIAWNDYRNLVLSGQGRQLAPLIFEQQQLATAARDEANRLRILRYLGEHPQLTRLAELFSTSPAVGGNVQPDGNNFLVTLPSGQQVVTMGNSFKFGGMADSIRTITSRPAQLALYTDWYGQLPAALLNSAAGLSLPTPASLANASLRQLQQAKSVIAGLSSVIASLTVITFPPGLTFSSCDAAIGSSPLEGDAGFVRFQIPTGCNHSLQGIYRNFDFPNKSYLPCIEDQGHRGLCHTFATLSATEEVIALNHGVSVNLSEQDEMEHLRLLWDPIDYYTDGESPSQEIQLIQSNGYSFAYENRWDYNPSFNRVTLSNGFFEHSCESPYPSTEPCSDTSPQAPLVCAQQGPLYCSFVDAGIVEGPYTITSGGANFWDFSNPDLSIAYMLLNLAFNNGVIWSFGVTNDFMGVGRDGFLPFDPQDLKITVGGHAVHVVGFVSNQDLLTKLPSAPPGSGGGYFIIKNSWNCNWGDGGYGYIPVDYVKATVWEATAVSGVN